MKLRQKILFELDDRPSGVDVGDEPLVVADCRN